MANSTALSTIHKKIKQVANQTRIKEPILQKQIVQVKDHMCTFLACRILAETGVCD